MKKRAFLIVTIVIATAMLAAACNIIGSGAKAKIAIGPPGSGTSTVSKIIFDAYGIEEGDYTEFQEGFGDAADGIKDGNIDISIGLLGLPAGSVVDLQASTGDVVLLGLSDEAVNYIEENSGYLEYTIPADSYDFLEDDVKTITAYAVLVANTDTVDDDLAYELARTTIEHADENTHAQAEGMTLENALNGANDLPIHPGAKRYYEEQGLTVDSAEAEVSAAERKNDLVLGTGSQGGTYYPLGGEIANIWNKHIDGINVTNTETGASVENLASISDGSMDLGMTVHVPAIEALNGTGEFDGAPVENFAFIGHIYPEVVQIVTRESTNITSFDELVE